MCQSFVGFGPVERTAVKVAGTSEEEARLLAGVLSLLRSGDRLYADGIRQAVARHEAEQKRTAARPAARKVR